MGGAVSGLMVYMVRDQRVPYECKGDPVAVFSTRELAENFIAVAPGAGYWIDPWAVDERLEDS